MDMQYMETQSLGGNNFELTIMDEASGKMLGCAIPKRHLTGDAAIPIFKSIRRQTGRKVIRIVLDNAPEFVGVKSTLGAWIIRKGIEPVPCTRYTSNENNLAELTNLLRINKVRTIRLHSQLPKSFWAEAGCFVRIINVMIV
jgi:hypothetical protein